MSAGGVVLLVVGIVGAVVVVQAAAWIVLRRWMKRRTAASVASLRDAALAANEAVVRGPESASYRGGHPDSGAKGNAVLLLTDRRVTWQMTTGRVFGVDRVLVTGVREERWFRKSATGGRTHLVIETDLGDIGFYVADNAAWRAAILDRANR